MGEINVQKVADEGKKPTLPVFKEMESVFDRIRARAFDLFSRRGFGDGHALDDWLAAEREICWPAGELVEQDKAVTLSVALPGFEPADILSHRHSASAGRTREVEDREQERGGSSRAEGVIMTRSNDVYRQVDLPKDIDPQSVSASLQNGLLKIVATKAEKPARVVPSTSAAA